MTTRPEAEFVLGERARLEEPTRIEAGCWFGGFRGWNGELSSVREVMVM